MSSMARKFVKKLERKISMKEALDKVFSGKTDKPLGMLGKMERNGKEFETEQMVMPFGNKTAREAFNTFFYLRNNLEEYWGCVFHVLCPNCIVLIACNQENKKDVEEFINELDEDTGEEDEEI